MWNFNSMGKRGNFNNMGKVDILTIWETVATLTIWRVRTMGTYTKTCETVLIEV